jgi:hypothetical protein
MRDEKGDKSRLQDWVASEVDKLAADIQRFDSLNNERAPASLFHQSDGVFECGGHAMVPWS